MKEKSEVIKYVDLSKLPKKGKGVDWESSKGHRVEFRYYDIFGELELLDFDKQNKTIGVKYKSTIKSLYLSSLHTCQLGGLLNVYTREFKVKIGTIFNKNDKSITIIDREYRDGKRGVRHKWYKYKCSIDNNEDWIMESSLLKGVGCNVCSNKKVLIGINDISTTHPHMIEYFLNKNDAFSYTIGSHEKTDFKCPTCGYIKREQIKNFRYHDYKFSCPACSIKSSYPNRFMSELLKSMDVKFIAEYSPDWISPKRYDFYIPSKNLIIEMDGGWHNSHNNLSGQSTERSKVIDNYKNMCACLQGIDIIRINCDYTNKNKFKYIKSSILNSGLNMYFNIKCVNFKKCNELALINKLKYVCDMYNNDVALDDLCCELNITKATVIKYLKLGTKYNLCNYEPQHERSRGKVKVKIVETGDIFKSIAECERQSLKMYGVKFNGKNISRVLNKYQRTHKGYHFEYCD